MNDIHLVLGNGSYFILQKIQPNNFILFRTYSWSLSLLNLLTTDESADIKHSQLLVLNKFKREKKIGNFLILQNYSKKGSYQIILIFVVIIPIMGQKNSKSS